MGWGCGIVGGGRGKAPARARLLVRRPDRTFSLLLSLSLSLSRSKANFPRRNGKESFIPINLTRTRRPSRSGERCNALLRHTLERGNRHPCPTVPTRRPPTPSLPPSLPPSSLPCNSDERVPSLSRQDSKQAPRRPERQQASPTTNAPPLLSHALKTDNRPGCRQASYKENRPSDRTRESLLAVSLSKNVPRSTTMASKNGMQVPKLPGYNTSRPQVRILARFWGCEEGRRQT